MDINIVVISKVTVKGYKATVKHKGHLVTRQRLVTMVSKLVSVNTITVNVVWDERKILSQGKNSPLNSCYLETEYQDKRVLDQDVEGFATTKAEWG